MRAAFADPRDREIQGFFHAVYQGARVRGLMVLTVENGKGYTSLIFDREDLFSQSLPGLARQMTASLPAATRGGSGGPPRPPAPLTRTQLLDGSGFLGLPAGWRITGSFKGVVDAVGPNGEGVSLGGYQQAFVSPLPGSPATMMSGPYRPPIPALHQYLDIQTQRAISRGLTTVRILEQAPVQAQTGQAAYISYEVASQGQALQALAMVNTSPIDNTTWLYYMSVVQAPKARFAQELPTLWAIWKSWSVNPAVFRERMDA
ncbi:MAG: hypothetical protein NTW28_09450, partial [Candidatus Solibacter sp.]|nr:hypothetical protein [Candidatus Solibacter sp.]